jgi:hypothetical protein
MNQYEAFIRERARAHNIDPDIAVQVALSEGGLDNPVRQSDIYRNGIREPSYGFFQLNIANGLGAEALRQGIDPRDPNQWMAATEFALSKAAELGWSPWMGAKRVGIGPYDGIGGVNKRVSGPVEAAGGGAGADVGATQLYTPPVVNPGPDLNKYKVAAADTGDIPLVQSRASSIADDLSSAVTTTQDKRQRSTGDGGLVYSDYAKPEAPLPEFTSATPKVSDGPPAMASLMPPADTQSLADLFKVKDIGRAGMIDPATGMPVLPQRRRTYG